MANSDKNILITPNTGSSTDNPKIEFTGSDVNTITLTTLSDGTLSFTGSAGQLFSISDNLSGVIFSVNDVSGIPSIEVEDNGTIRLAEFAGNVLIGTNVDNGVEDLQVGPNGIFADGNITLGNTSKRSYLKIASDQWPEIRYQTPSDNETIKLGQAHAANSTYSVAAGDWYVYSTTNDDMRFIVPKAASELKTQRSGNTYTLLDSGNYTNYHSHLLTYQDTIDLGASLNNITTTGIYQDNNATGFHASNPTQSSGTLIVYRAATPSSQAPTIIQEWCKTGAEEYYRRHWLQGTTTYSSWQRIWTSSSFSGTDISNWGTAYTYSQVGHLPLAGGTMTGGITATASTHKLGGIKISPASATSNYIAFYGTTGDQPGSYNHSYIGDRIHSGTEGSELLIAKYNDVEGAAGSDRVRVIANNFQVDTYTAATTPAANASIDTAAGTGTLYTRFNIRQNGDIEVGGSKFVDSSRNITAGTITATGGDSSNWNTAYGWGNHAGKYLRRYESTVTFGPTAYTRVARVTGDRLGSGVRVHLSGTSGNVVLNIVADILVNHSNDIIIESLSGNYTQVYIQVISDANENFDIYLKRSGGSGDTGIGIDIFTYNDEVVTFSPTAAAYTGTTHEHLTAPGKFISASDSGAADFKVEDVIYAAGGNSGNWNTAYSDTTAATSANTASTIVKRDGSGNFSAGTITSSALSTGSITAQVYNSYGGQELILTAGESWSQLIGVTGGNPLQGEFVYAVAEEGLQVISSPDNWLDTGSTFYNDASWAKRNVATINDSSGNTSLPNNLSIGGTIRQSRIYRPNVSWGAAGSTTGQIAIKLPETIAEYDMVNIEIDVYDYSSEAGSKIHVSGHNYNGSIGWYNYNVRVIGACTKPIYIGKNATQYYILIGDVGSGWSYGQVHVTKVTTATYYNVLQWDNAWGISQVTTDPTTTKSTNLNQLGSTTLQTRGMMRSEGGYRVGGTTVIDSNRNAEFASQLIVRGAGNSSKGNIHMGNAGDGAAKWSYLTGAHYNADTESEGISLIGCYASDTVNRVILGGSIYEANPATSVEIWAHNAITHATGGSQIAVFNTSGLYVQTGNLNVSTGSVKGTSLKSESSSPLVVLNDTNGTNDTDTTGYISFQTAGSERAWIGFGSAGSPMFRISRSSGDIDLHPNGGNVNITTGGLEINGTSVIDSSRNINGVSIDASGELEGAYIGVSNSTSNNGYGISLYGGGTAGEPTYGLMFQGTPTFGTHGGVTGSWATYFTMNNDNTRGWIFRKAGVGNVASIDGAGDAKFDGTLTTGSDLTIGGTKLNLANSAEVRCDTQINFLTSTGAAQFIEIAGAAASDSYNQTSMYTGEFNARYGYRVGNTQFIDSSRNIYNVNLNPGISYYNTTIGNNLNASEIIHRRAGSADVLSDGLEFNSALFTVPRAYGRNGSTWTDLGDWHVLTNGKTAQNWSGVALSRTYQEFVIYFGSQMGYSFFNSMTILHSTNGNGMRIYGESIETSTNPYDAGWNVRYDTGGNVGSWPGSTTLTGNVAHGGGYDNLFRVRIVPNWSHASNSITLGQIIIKSGYGTPRRLFDWDQNRNVTFTSDVKIYNGGDLEVGNYDDTTTSVLKLNGYTASRQSKLQTTNGNLHIDSHAGYGIYLNYYSSTGFVMFMADKGKVDASGNATFNGDVTAFGTASDIRLKTDIQKIDNALDKVSKLNGVTFEYKKEGKRSTGLIAQEVEKVLPEAVYEVECHTEEDTENYKALRYGNIVGLLVEAIKEQQNEINELKALVKQLMEK